MVRFFQLFFSNFFNLINFLIFLLTANYSYQDDKELCMRRFMDDDRGGCLYWSQHVCYIQCINWQCTSLYIHNSTCFSPLALTYYGLCLVNENYTVKLQLSEIIFTDDNSLNSIGNRLFDVYIQVTKLFLVILEKWRRNCMSTLAC
jgi:hypothetical protein